MTRHSGIKISALFVVLATSALANSNGIWDGYALPHDVAQPASGHTPGSYKAWLDNVRPQGRDPSAFVHLVNHQMRVAQEDYTTYESNETKYTDTSTEPYTTEEVQPTYETHPHPVYKSTEPYACPPPIEPTTVTATVTCTVTEPAPPPVTVTSVCTVTETVTVEVEPTTQVYYNSYNVVAPPYTQAVYYTTTPVYNAPVYTAPAYTAPAYNAPVYTAPVYTAPVYTAPVYTAPAQVYTAPVYTAPVYTAPVYTAPVYTAPPPVYGTPPPPVYATPPPAYSTPEPVYSTSAYSSSSSAYSSSSSPYSTSSSPYGTSSSPYSTSSPPPTYTAAPPTYASVSESTTIITVTHTSVSTATYTSVYDNISEVTVTETSYPVTKKSAKPKKGKKAVRSQLIKTGIPVNPWVRIIPTPMPTGRMADGDEGDEIVHRGQARNAVATGDIVIPDYAGDIGFRLKHENLRRNA
ncbi:hypothetical protein GGH13_002532 [Coemansia sp. S155-1]|nr:hypothetical protein GGI14_004018 [Coemansia sp. S680]KAJ2036800.1 hypothetical protein H4S03_003402 [Coemansia sp. S3946]KAJ2072661.1 hypothetical protein GGH13_002532 [Coemansia sp. S155-1]